MLSRYLATVLLATFIPSSSNILAILLSDNGLAPSSSPISRRIRSLIAAPAKSSLPLTETTEEDEKN